MGFFNRDGGRGGKPQGGNRFGDKPFKKRSYGGDDRGGYGSNGPSKPMFEATCAECGRMAQVPFRPNGSKPVLCRDCFRSEDDGPRQIRTDRDSRGRSSSYGGGRSSSSERPSAPRRDDGMERRLNEMDKKLNLVLEQIVGIAEILSELGIVGEEDEDEDDDIDDIDDEETDEDEDEDENDSDDKDSKLE
ncbi:MAG: CxxC-x17-CxxC domain-containing protein [Patescibacteria group bacterium]